MSREKYFQKQFGCKVNQNGYGQPTAVFTTTTSGESFTNSVKFINDYYVNERVLSKSLLFLFPQSQICNLIKG